MVKLNKIYTRTGDDGTSGLVDGSRLAKADPLFAAIGDVDELNSALGLALCHIAEDDLIAMVRRVQNDLFDLGADLATPAGEGEDFAPSEMVLRIVESQVRWLEASIDALNDRLEPLTSFILPGGTKAAAAVHVARAIARRAERAMVASGQRRALNPQALIYANRLSDLLFVLGRVLNDNGRADIKWVPGASR